MNIPRGYKLTELGIIPEEWEVRVIDDCLSIGNGRDYKGKSLGNIPVYGTGGIITYINDYLHDGQTICIGRKGTINKPFYHNGKIWTVDTLYYTYNFCNVDVKYLYYSLSTIDWMSLNEATGVPSLTSDRIKRIDILLPPLPEQKAIAKALSDVDDLIAALDKKIAKKRLVKQGAMQQLLTGKKRLPGFTEEWVVKKLGDIGFTYSGLTGKSKDDFGQGNAKYITFLNVLTNPIIKEEYFESVVVRDNEHQNIAMIGDLFFNTSSETPEEVGTCAVLLSHHTKLYLNSFCFGYRLIDNNVVGLFLAYYFRSYKGRQLMTSLAQGATRYNLSKELFNSSSIMLPRTREEQQAIAAILSDMDKEIANLEKQRDNYCLLKSGMMQQLLTGQVRLKK